MKSGKKTSLYDSTFIVCDVETTGLSATQNRIIEIALIKVQGGEIVDKYKTLVNPHQHIPRFITELTGITNEDLVKAPAFDDIAVDILKFFGIDKKQGKANASDEVVFVGHNAGFDYKFLSESFRRTPDAYEIDFKTLCTCKMARRLFRKLKSKSLSSVATHLGIVQKNKHRAYDDTLATAKILLHSIEILQDEYEIETLEELLTFQNTKIFTEENKSPALKRVNINLRDLPESPGVYFMKSRSGEVLYIGKAKNLKERVSTYFRHNSELPFKIKKLLTRIHSLEYEIANSELSALILESKLIKKNKPRFNTAIKRFRHHPFLKLDIQNEFPKIEKVYEIENDGAYYYGPFTSGLTVNKLVKDIKEKYKLRKCEERTIKASKKNSNCMYFDIGMCDAPCNTTISKDEYSAEVEKVHDFITGENGKSAMMMYRSAMDILSQKMDFERAAFVRDRLRDIEKVMSYQKVITSAINDKKLIIKCDNGKKREVFFVHNGKLSGTRLIDKGNEYDQSNILNDIMETTDYLFFSLSRYAKHKFSQYELDEIKVISNWLALNRDRNSFLEVNENHTMDELVKFIVS